jgi:hypothetical protein
VVAHSFARAIVIGEWYSLGVLCAALAVAQHREVQQQFVDVWAKLACLGAGQKELEVCLDGTASRADIVEIRRELSASVLGGAWLWYQGLPFCKQW